MSQEMLNDLSILCIEKDMIEHTNVSTIISDFAAINALHATAEPTPSN